MTRKIFLFVLLAVGGLAGCGGSATGPVEVHWDRDTCVRCRMVLSDHNHAAQVRGGPAGEKTKPHEFDDIGCALLWLEQQPWRDEPRTEIWVSDRGTGQWLDARKAAFVKGDKTPMAYGLGAQPQAAPGTLDLAAAQALVREREAKHNAHGTSHGH